MKRVFFLLAAIIMTATCAVAQSFTVVDGGVTWRYNVSDVGTNPMPFHDGTLTIAGHTYILGSGLNVSVSSADAAIEPLIVDVCFAGTETTVEAPGALADRLTIKVTGGNVDITAAPSLAQEIAYNLHGTGESFALHGDYKATVVLDNVDLTANGTTPALWVDCGKRIDFVVTDKSKNTFKDSAANEKKSAFHVKGHAEWKGDGFVTITGNSRHAYSSNEYTLFKQSFGGHFKIDGAVSDGMHIEQYLQVNNGFFNLINVKGDGIDVSYALEDDGVTPTKDESNGQFIMNGGSIQVNATADDTKGLKCEDNMTITAGTITATATGAGSRGVQTSKNLYLGTEGATDAKVAYVKLTASGGDYTDPESGDVNKCRGLKVKENFYHYPSTVERDAASTVKAKKIVDVDGTYFNEGGTLSGITIE